MIPNLIAEIGINHFGKFSFLKSYIKKVKNKNIYGISIQILNKKKVKPELKNYCLKKKDIRYFVSLAKKNFKNVGIAIHSWDDFKFIKELKLDFIKILGSSLGDKNYFENINKINVKKIFLSTLNKSEVEIMKFLKRIDKSKITLIYTFSDAKGFEHKIKKIKIYKKKFKLKVAYGNHHKNISLIEKVCKYHPSEIFFYVKFNSKKKYPDNKHAIPISKLKNFIKKINYYDKI